MLDFINQICILECQNFLASLVEMESKDKDQEVEGEVANQEGFLPALQFGLYEQLVDYVLKNPDDIEIIPKVCTYTLRVIRQSSDHQGAIHLLLQSLRYLLK